MNFNYCPNCGNQSTVVKQDKTNYHCKKCGWHFWNNAKAATALILIKDGLILFGQRATEPKKGMYDLPGGFVDFGENGEAAAIREASEELSITILERDLELLNTYSFDYSTDTSTVDLVFLVHHWQGKLTPNNEEVAAVTWRPVSFLNDPSFMQSASYRGLDELLAAKRPDLKQ